MGFFVGGVVAGVESGRFCCGDVDGTDTDVERARLTSAGVGSLEDRVIAKPFSMEKLCVRIRGL